MPRTTDLTSRRTPVLAWAVQATSTCPSSSWPLPPDTLPINPGPLPPLLISSRPLQPTGVLGLSGAWTLFCSTATPLLLLPSLQLLLLVGGLAAVAGVGAAAAQLGGAGVEITNPCVVVKSCVVLNTAACLNNSKPCRSKQAAGRQVLHEDNCSTQAAYQPSCQPAAQRPCRGGPPQHTAPLPAAHAPAADSQHMPLTPAAGCWAQRLAAAAVDQTWRWASADRPVVPLLSLLLCNRSAHPQSTPCVPLRQSPGG